MDCVLTKLSSIAASFTQHVSEANKMRAGDKGVDVFGVRKLGFVDHFVRKERPEHVGGVRVAEAGLPSMLAGVVPNDEEPEGLF